MRDKKKILLQEIETQALLCVVFDSSLVARSLAQSPWVAVDILDLDLTNHRLTEGEFSKGQTIFCKSPIKNLVKIINLPSVFLH